MEDQFDPAAAFANNQREAISDMAAFARNFLEQEQIRRKASAAASTSNATPVIDIKSSTIPLPPKSLISESPDAKKPSAGYPLRFYVWREGKIYETDILCDYPPSEKQD